MDEEPKMINGHYPSCNHKDKPRKGCRVCDKKQRKLTGWYSIPITHRDFNFAPPSSNYEHQAIDFRIEVIDTALDSTEWEYVERT